MFDVVVVGAGPAGSTTARYLGDMGFEVCLLDKSTFPRDKPCGGGFSPRIFERFPYLRPRKTEFLDRVLNVGVLHSPSRRITLKGRAKMAVALRSKFDNVLFEEAHDAGAQCMTGKRAKQVSIRDNGVEVAVNSGETLSARFVIGADGVNSVVAGDTGLNTTWARNKITACRVAEVPAMESKIMNLYDTEGAYHFYANLFGSPGYGWIFPKTETINIGVGIRADRARNMQKVFNCFAHYLISSNLLPQDADISNVKGAIVPTGGTLEPFVHNRCLLIGDSAGMVNPLTGGGIMYAMEAGRIAASVIDRCLAQEEYEEEILLQYQKQWARNHGKDMASMLLAQKIFTSCLAETLFEIGARDEQIQEMISNAMAESEIGTLDLPELIGRVIIVCLKQAVAL